MVDSSGWIEHFLGTAIGVKFRPFLDSASPANSISSSLVIYEVYKRLRPGQGEKVAVGYAEQIRAATRMIEIEFHLALSAADLSIGERLSMADAVILATARREKALLVTTDEKFKGIPGVKWIDPGPRQGR